MATISERLRGWGAPTKQRAKLLHKEAADAFDAMEAALEECRPGTARAAASGIPNSEAHARLKKIDAALALARGEK